MDLREILPKSQVRISVLSQDIIGLETHTLPFWVFILFAKLPRCQNREYAFQWLCCCGATALGKDLDACISSTLERVDIRSVAIPELAEASWDNVHEPTELRPGHGHPVNTNRKRVRQASSLTHNNWLQKKPFRHQTSHLQQRREQLITHW